MQTRPHLELFLVLSSMAWMISMLSLRFAKAGCAALPLLASCAVTTAPLPPAAVELTVQPVFEQQAYRALKVSLAFNGCASGRTTLTLPDEWGGETQLYKALRDFQAPGAQLEPGLSPAQRVLIHAPGQRLVLHYRVVSDAASRPDQPKAQGNDYRPILEPSHFQVLGNALVVQPQCTAQQAQARFVLKGLPAGDVFASDLQHQSMGRAITMGDLVESVLVGGDFRLIDAGGGARLAVRGAWPWSDAQWKDNFARVASAVRSYWRSADEPYLVTVLQRPSNNPGHSSVGGTGRSDAFAFFATPNVQPPRLLQTMAHEMTHTWVPRRIGGLPQQGQIGLYWLSEGFADWAAWRAMLRAGVWSPAEFAAVFNESLQSYELSPVRNAPNSTIEQQFWSDAQVQTLPYQRGMLLAAHWDIAVQRATQGQKRFDDVLLTMQAAAAARKDLRAVELLRQAMQSVAGIDIAPDLQSYVEQGQTVPLADTRFAGCGRLQTIDRPAFHRGFDVERTAANGNVIAGVVAEGPAFRAGLRDGMKLVARRAGEIGDATVEIAYEVIEGNNAPRLLRWMPAGPGREMFRKLVGC
jgi:predicted metalloprotease with PDZ domain